MSRALSLALLLAALPFAAAQDKTATTVPFRLSKTQHIVIRCKIDGKGPFNFVVDTGCPVLVISTEAAKKAGLTSEKGAGVIKKLEFEGGLAQDDVKVRIETPFQIEGMNAMGLPGVELHGLMGYTVLAKYRIEIDLTKEKMAWTPLAFDPPPLEKLKLKEGDGMNLDMMGGFLKIFARLAGLKPAPPPVPRGFAGLELQEKDKAIRVASVLAGSPAAEAGLKAGDEITAIEKKSVANIDDARRAVAQLIEGREVRVAITRDGEKQTLTLKLAAGL